jgi:hypothetical protein
MAFFAANKKEEEDESAGHILPTSCIACDTLYQEFPQKFVWDPKKKKWTVLKRGWAIGRMYSISPSARECFYIWLLLTVVQGMSFLFTIITHYI